MRQVPQLPDSSAYKKEKGSGVFQDFWHLLQFSHVLIIDHSHLEVFATTTVQQDEVTRAVQDRKVPSSAACGEDDKRFDTAKTGRHETPIPETCEKIVSTWYL